MNSVLFITHHNNDFDNFLPVIIALKKEGINIKIISFHHKHEILQNELQNYICNENSISLDSIIEMYYLKLLTRFIVRLHTFILDNKLLDTKILLNRRNPKLIIRDFIKEPAKSILRFTRSFCYFYLRFGSLLLMNDKKCREYILKNNIKLVITDMRGIDQGQLKLSKFGKIYKFIKKGFLDTLHDSMFKFMYLAREEKIPIIMMPHGTYPVNDNSMHQKLYGLEESGFKPDYLFLENNMTKYLYHGMRGIIETIPIGVPRYDVDWIKYLDACINKAYPKKETKNKILLYIADCFPYKTNNDELWKYKFEREKEILSIVNHIEDIEIWVKHHPRNDHRIPIEVFISNGKQQNIKQFGIGHDTNVLVAHADICLSQLSSVFVSPIISKKPSIVYEKWKELFPGANTIFDYIKYRAKDVKELIALCKKILAEGYDFSDEDVKKYCMGIFPITEVGNTMTRNYVEKIKKIMAS